MKAVITKEDVDNAIRRLVDQGKKPTISALYAALDSRGSMSTLVKLKAEIDASAQRQVDSPEALDAFREVWALAREERRKETERLVAELRDSIYALAAENERCDGIIVGAQKRIADLEEAKSNAEADLNQLRISAERDLSRATATMRDAGLQAANALQELADARGAHAAQISVLQAELAIAQRNAHNFQLQLVRALALLEAKGQASDKSSPLKSRTETA